MVGMWLASEAPERVERLVLCCTSAQFVPPETWEERAQTVRADGVGDGTDAVLERWFTPVFQADQPDTFEWAGHMLRETPPEGYAGCCEAIRDADLRDRLANVRAPTLVVAGADDPAAPPEHGERICDEFPDAQLVIVSQARHLANVEQPEEITQAVLSHLGPLTERRGSL
jgi:3-oxoadipate enol-lactonase